MDGQFEVTIVVRSNSETILGYHQIVVRSNSETILGYHQIVVRSNSETNSWVSSNCGEK